MSSSRKVWSVTALVVLVSSAVLAQGSGPAPQGSAPTESSGPAAESSDLAVTLDYTGPGTVDTQHQLWLWVFDTPHISPDETPVDIAALSENKGVITLRGLPKTVYLAAAYDDKGGYDGRSGPPPPGTPITIHGFQGDRQADPVETGKDAAVTVTFDDTQKMPESW